MPEKSDLPIDGRRARGAIARVAILATATDLFSTRGYAGTSIAAIAQGSDVNSGSIYHAFGSKEGVLQAVLGAAADQAFSRIEDLDNDDTASPATRLSSAARLLIDDPVFLRLFLRLALEKDNSPVVRASVERVRARARSVVVAAIGPELDAVPAEYRPAAADAIGRLTLVLLDGIFVSQQLDSEAADLEQTLALMTGLTDLAIRHLPDLAR